ncbi:cAMP-binding domain of CRP or a regulatory subunit of cAMP-dependent protein kinases [Aliiroseovarius halocynthiae]|uniref:Crp/Fnr family transcriptional regulator n=1 Tax=Aliiroseovarius halocynthiae TaxID=985055 RepID=A0A545SUF2_9RHOB|nr:Crp/Fnr family transcriptional regulator [Aliiroseovarius halocynthiae]TQV68585.1 Crp/Fnr family transcriptional regulator [Aliiroseovarius halocynthiae]SMR70994.1 cAMP-binding domain of CRP or a regulatory subunit of cAMP-dependent protein kinases [Aliiroseovarius halocynthiae]
MVLSSLSAGALERLRQRGHTRIFKKKDVVFRFGDPGLTLLIVTSGRAEVSVTSVLGQKSILGVATEGDVLGDIACLDGGPRSADVIALDRMEVVEVQRGEVLLMLREDPDSAILVIEALCQKARNASEMFEVQTLHSGQARLAACLLRLLTTSTQTDEGVPAIKVSQSWLGAYASLTRENVNRQLKTWAREGVARFEKGFVVIDDLERLEEISLGDDQ